MIRAPSSLRRSANALSQSVIAAGPGDTTGASSPMPIKGKRGIKDSPTLILFVLPALVLFVGLYLVPAFNTLRYSVTEWDGFMPAQFVGVDNYTRLATNDSVFVEALGNNLEFMLWVVIFQTGFGFLFAMLLLRNTRTSIALRTLFFFPTILSSVSVAMIWLFLLDPNVGFINTSLASLGITDAPEQGPNWLGSETTALYALVFVQVWFHFGQMMVIYVAGLQQIPQELYEAARVDGANGWQVFLSVTWPMAIPTTGVVVAYTTIQTFRAFDLVYATTQGGPSGSTEILATIIYRTGMNDFRVGYAAAQSVIFIIVIFLVTWLQRRILRTQYQV